ncbi:MAG: hypothetical protein N2558_03700 [Patescibacteria group bacterium]|nr:hypothetical protein [Patescibacteria group bacterium]
MGCNSSNGIETAIGCISLIGSNPLTDMIYIFLRLGGNIVGGMGLILIVYSGYMLMTSAGNPQKVQAAKELLTASISGILMLLFAVFLLRIIGSDLLILF